MAPGARKKENFGEAFQIFSDDLHHSERKAKTVEATTEHLARHPTEGLDAEVTRKKTQEQTVELQSSCHEKNITPPKDWTLRIARRSMRFRDARFKQTDQV